MSDTVKERIFSFVRLAIPLICLVLSWFSVELDADQIVTWVLDGLTVIFGVIAWFKDNNVSSARCALSTVVKQLTAKVKAGDEIVMEDDE